MQLHKLGWRKRQHLYILARRWCVMSAKCEISLHMNHFFVLVHLGYAHDLVLSMCKPAIQASDHTIGGTAWMTKAHGQQKGNNQLQDCVTIFPIITDLLPEVPGAIVYERLPLLQGAISTSSNHPFKMFCLSTLSGKPTSTINLATSPTSCALMSLNNDFTACPCFIA